MSNTSNTSDSQKKPTNPQNSENAHNRTEDGGAEHRPGPMEVLRHARTQLAELTGMAAESVSSFEQTDDGWVLEIEVLELTRVPDTMSLLASYQVALDPQGELMGYRRIRRYERGRADSRGPGAP
ncbi:gas vesicle protein [Streptomyces mirabilis]|uniref:gas vesicle protein GvpO n=1 Tax=Streptomyces mirabilis TaxID=68239 RepID=UPI0036251AE3